MHVIKATRVSSVHQQPRIPGMFAFEALYRGILYICPCGCNGIGFLPFQPINNLALWRFDGNKDAPTLEPSVKRTATCGFHGVLVKGEWQFCDDSGQAPASGRQ